MSQETTTTEANSQVETTEVKTGDETTTSDNGGGEKSELQKTLEAGDETKTLVTTTAELPKEYLAEDGSIDQAKVAAALKNVVTDVPNEDGAYDFAFPEGVDIKGEDGQQLKLDTSDPIVKSFEDIAKKHSLGQSAVSALMGLYADMIGMSKEVASSNAATAQSAELKLLDANPEAAEARVNAAAEAGVALLGPELGKILIANMTSAGMVRVVEKFLNIEASEGAGDPKTETGSETGKSAAEILYPQTT